MSALVPIPAPPLRLVLTTDGAIATIGRADLVPGSGQRVITVPDDAYPAFVAVADKLGADEEATYDEQARRFGRRKRARTPQDEAREREASGLPARVAALETALGALTAHLGALEAVPVVKAALATGKK